MSRWNEEEKKVVFENHGPGPDWDDRDDDDIIECARVEAPSPWIGMWISAQPDMFPKSFTPAELDDVYWELTRGDGLDKLMEAASFEEFDSWYNPGTEEVDPAFITEALVVKKFARTEAVMRRGLVKALRRFLDAKDPTTGTPIELLDPIVGKPRKSGMYAYVTVQLPFSDGQVVSILFHAPEGDGKRITPSDTIVAFRWMLNKRDITNIVAPEDGKDVSVATIGRRLSLLVEKNAPRFANTQKEAQAEKRELARVTDRVKELKAEIDKVATDIEDTSLDLETETARNGNTRALVQKQKTTNAELRTKLDALQKLETERNKVEADKEPGETEVETETGENGVGGGEETPPANETEDSVEELHKGVSGDVMQVLRNADTRFQWDRDGNYPWWDAWEAGKNVLLYGPSLEESDLGMTAGAEYRLTNLRNENATRLQNLLKHPGSFVVIPIRTLEDCAKVCLIGVKRSNAKRFQTMVSAASLYPDKEAKVKFLANLFVESSDYFPRDYKSALSIWQEAQKLTLDEILQMGAAPETETPADVSAEPSTEEPTATDTGVQPTATETEEPTTEEPATENPVPDDPAETADTVETEEPATTEEPSTEEPGTIEPAFVTDLNDILAGKYDNDLNRVTEIMRTAVAQVATPGMEQYQELANNASRYFTKLLAGAFAKKVA